MGLSGVGGVLDTDGIQKQSKYPIPNLPFTGPRISILSNSRPVIAPRVLFTLLSATHHPLLIKRYGSVGHVLNIEPGRSEIYS